MFSMLYINLSPQVIYAVAAVSVGILGRRRLIGFWGFLILSLLLTPVAGLLMLAVTEYAAPSD